MFGVEGVLNHLNFICVFIDPALSLDEEDDEQDLFGAGANLGLIGQVQVRS